MVAGRIFPDIKQEALRCTPSHKAAGPDNVYGLVLAHMPIEFHEALRPFLQSMTLAWITPLLAPKSH
jgi:hypothetical protein